MFGCLTRSAYLDSRRKRSRISELCARSSGSTFSAARRDCPSCSSASQTTPMPPSPSWDSRRKPPTTSPMLNVAATRHSYHRREQEFEIQCPKCVGVRPRMCEGVEVVGDDDNPAAHGDLVLDFPVRIAGPVPALVMRKRDL